MMGFASCRWQTQAQMDGTTMTIEKDGMGSGEPEQLRPARMKI